MRLGVSFFYYFANNIGFRLLKFVALIICARLLTLRDFGIFSTLFSLISIFGAISVFGMHNTVIKFAEETSRGGMDRFRRLLRLSFGVNVFLGLAFTAIVLVFRDFVCHYLGVPMFPLFIAAATIIPWAVSRTMTFVFRALREPKKSVAVDVAGPALFLLGLFILVVTDNSSLRLVMLGNLLAFALPVIIGFSLVEGFTRRLQAPTGDLEQKSTSEILSFSFFAFIVTISGVSGGELDRLLLAWFLDPQAVGLYNAAARTAFQFNLLYFSFSYAFSPQLIKERLDNDSSRERDYKRWSLLFWLAAPIFLVAIGLGRYVLLLFGPDYLPALAVFLIIALGGYLNLLLGPSEIYLRMCGYQKVEALNMVLAMLLTISLDLLLIPKLGIHGAAIGSAAGFVTFKILSTIYAACRGFIYLPLITWWRISYVGPPLFGALTFSHPVFLAALVALGLILFFAVEKVPIKELAETMKAIATHPEGSQA